jgi:hypothetical protein
MSLVVRLTNNSYKPITNTAWVRTRLCKLQKKGAFDSQPQVIKFTSCLPMVGGSLWVLRLLPSLKLVAKVALNTKNQINQIIINNISQHFNYFILFLDFFHCSY